MVRRKGRVLGPSASGARPLTVDNGLNIREIRNRNSNEASTPVFLDKDVVKLGDIDVSGLAAHASALPEDVWAQEASRQKKFPAHIDTQTIWMIYDADFRHLNPTRHAMMDACQAYMEPVMGVVREHYAEGVPRVPNAPDQPGYFIRIIMTRLNAGGAIKPHVDGGYSLKRCHRIHAPLITNEKCMFTTGDTTLHMRAGELWEINNRQLHGVVNDGDEPRVHMILDYVVPGELIPDPKGEVVA